ncbi:hypothetical protein AYO45_02540 [Gammaproteobacteria bacterium SCGC AG-212-F23]|nr:hypothetical protein AYO45_02540 [Gammaproteobacteria bacterium SCGC AG-212-F23]
MIKLAKITSIVAAILFTFVSLSANAFVPDYTTIKIIKNGDYATLRYFVAPVPSVSFPCGNDSCIGWGTHPGDKSGTGTGYVYATNDGSRSCMALFNFPIQIQQVNGVPKVTTPATTYSVTKFYAYQVDCSRYSATVTVNGDATTGYTVSASVQSN